MSSAKSPNTVDVDTPRNNFLVFNRQPYISPHTLITIKNSSAMFAPTKESKTPSLANHMSAAPHTVSDLRPVGIIDPSGILSGLCLESPSGEVANVVSTNGFPGNILYRGSYRGIAQAMETAASMGHPGTLCWLTNPASSFDMMAARLPPGHRKVDLKIRYIDSEPKDKPIAKYQQSQDEWMMIVFPRDRTTVGDAQPDFDPAKEPPITFKEVVQDSLLGTLHRVGQFW
ncbi:Ff.00g107380.m01.CDS01 [Fusarium sp. VM40]|nr:Ff.00g107380.m01.CDS01 [Fusarium sp. VM40]